MALRAELIDSTRRCWANAGACSRNAENTAARLANVQRPDAPSRCIIRLSWPSGSRPGAYGDYVLSVGRLESVKRADLAIEAMAHVDRPVGWCWRATGRSARTLEALAERLGVARSRALPRRRARTRR